MIQSETKINITGSSPKHFKFLKNDDWSFALLEITNAKSWSSFRDLPGFGLNPMTFILGKTNN